MAKLIFSERVIKEITDISSIVGHEIVVYKMADGKPKWAGHLEENQEFQEARKTFFQRLLRSKSEPHLGYAVDLNPHLQSEHSSVFQYDDFNSFDLTYSIEYRVIDASRLVSKVIQAGEDALAELRRIVAYEVEKRILRPLRVNDIFDLDTFKDSTTGLAKAGSYASGSGDPFLSAMVEVYSIINEKVSDVGLRVNVIDLSRALSADEVRRIEEEKRIAEAYAKQLDELERNKVIGDTQQANRQAVELGQAEHKNKITLKNLEGDRSRKHYELEIARITEASIQELEDMRSAGERGRLADKNIIQIRKAIGDAAEKALLQVADGVTTAPQLRGVIKELTQTFNELTNGFNGGMPGGFAGTGPELSAATFRLLDQKPQQTWLADLTDMFLLMIEILNNPEIPETRSRALMSNVLSLLGRLVQNKESDDVESEKIFGAIKNQLGTIKLEHLSADQQQKLRGLINFDDLKKRFS